MTQRHKAWPQYQSFLRAQSRGATTEVGQDDPTAVFTFQ